MSRPLCLVTGATGAIGSGVVAALAGTHDVRVLSRRPAGPDLFRVPVTVFAGDVADVHALRCAARGADVIVHLAALLHIVDPPPALRAEYERVNVTGTAAVMEAATMEGVSRVVLMSTVAVYGSRERMLLDEDSPPRPETFYGETKLAAERIALEARRDDGSLLATVLRSAAVYGPRVKGNYQRLVQALARRRFVPIGPGDNLRTLIFEEDLASAAALAAVHPAAAGRIYNVSDGRSHPLREIIAAICEALGRRPPRWHAPVGPVRAALRAAALIDRRLPRLLDKYLEEIAVDGSRIQAELGFRPAFGLADGWRATIAEMRRAGLL
ncbi:NAD-dependent epimerase/dehydratase family protein [soil metagenome]